MLQRKRF